MGGPSHNTATPFMAAYLGLASGTSDSGDYTSVDGRGFYTALGNSALSFPYSDFTDELVLGAGAELAFEGNNLNDGAISKLGTNWFTSFLSFGLEVMPAAKQQEAFERFALWCEAARTMHADDFESNGFTFWDDVQP
jgi:hypothetical protein